MTAEELVIVNGLSRGQSAFIVYQETDLNMRQAGEIFGVDHTAVSKVKNRVKERDKKTGEF